MKINIIEYFDKTVRDTPKKIAIIDGDLKISFSELSINARNFAVEISKLNVVNKPIAVFLPKSVECITSDIAITYSGNIYMNLDVKTPLSRISNILEQIKPVALITNEKYSTDIINITGDIPTLLFREAESHGSIDINIIEEIKSKIIDNDPLCIINTSGSTGTPKGVVLNHKSYIDYLEWAVNTFGFTGEETLGVLSPTVFDHYNYEICLMMSKGVTLVLLDNQMASFPVKLLEVLRKHKVTYIFWVPSIMVNIANMDLLNKFPLPLIKMVWFAGEVFPTKQFNYWKINMPKATFVNLYGPVEASVDCTYFIVDREFKDHEPIPIGFPCRNTDIIILNSDNQIASENEEGELCIRGTSLAMGYYNNPKQTAVAFVQNPLNKSYPETIYRTGDIVSKNERGEMVFKGRKDSLIKHMGYRIELGEIEHVIVNTLKLVDAGCVVYNRAKKEITLFYQCNKEVSIAQIKKSIGAVFPKYMVPTVFHKMEELPRNTNGKLDRIMLYNLANNE
ncbi:MAG: amino acid adenylation domain-containing protein [Bacteroidales bacterium]